MTFLFYIHFNEAELAVRLQQLAHLDVQLSGHWNTQQQANLIQAEPGIVVVSLQRLPSHGRQYVQWFWQAKKRQHIPVIFTDGQHDKILTAKQQFPKAHFCTSDQLPALVQQLIA